MKEGIKGLKATFRSLTYRNYRLFFGGQSISLIGTWIQRIATPWLVYDLTNSVLLLGIVGFVGQIPTFLLSPIAGVLTDRWNRYNILITTQVLSMLQAIILAWLVFSGRIQVWHILVLSGFLGCINAFDVPARQSFVIQMVDKKEDLSNAIALNSSMVIGARLIGPSVAGVLIAATGEGVCFLLNAISYIFVIWPLLLMKVAPIDNKNGKTSVLKELAEGISYTFGSAPIATLGPDSGQQGTPFIVINRGARWKCSFDRSLPMTHISVPFGLTGAVFASRSTPIQESLVTLKNMMLFFLR